VLEFARGQGRRLARFRALDLEQDDLIDRAALRELRREFRDVFDLPHRSVCEWEHREAVLGEPARHHDS
jgi:hypothetical protein